MTEREQQGLMRLRVELYTAAQTLKGDALADFTQLIREIAMVLNVVPIAGSSVSEVTADPAVPREPIDTAGDSDLESMCPTCGRLPPFAGCRLHAFCPNRSP